MKRTGPQQQPKKGKLHDIVVALRKRNYSIYDISHALKEQGTLIASGLMAGAAIIGTIGAILLLPQLGESMLMVDVLHSSEQGAGIFANWYESLGGQLVSVLGLAALVACCYFLAKKGAQWQVEEEQE